MHLLDLYLCVFLRVGAHHLYSAQAFVFRSGSKFCRYTYSHMFTSHNYVCKFDALAYVWMLKCEYMCFGGVQWLSTFVQITGLITNLFHYTWVFLFHATSNLLHYRDEYCGWQIQLNPDINYLIFIIHWDYIVEICFQFYNKWYFCVDQYEKNQHKSTMIQCKTWKLQRGFNAFQRLHVLQSGGNDTALS